MGRIKEIYMQIMQINEGISEGMTISDIAEMQSWTIDEWEKYVRDAERRKLQHSQSESTEKTDKTEKQKGE